MDPVTIHPVIMSGGSGARLWPASRRAHPKQFKPLAGGATLFEQTVRRMEGRTPSLSFAPPAVIGAACQAGLIGEQLASAGADGATVILEPLARNTAPCAAVAALHGAGFAPDALVLLAPADHRILDTAAFHEALAQGARAALDGHIVTFGAAPTRPETGFGYIKRGAPIAGGYAVDRFVEKPDLETAKAFLAEGGYAWNTGIFLFRADILTQEMAAHCPEVLDAARRAWTAAAPSDGGLMLDRDAFAQAPAVAVDVAVMEKTGRAATVPIEMGWSDVGSWSAVWELAEKDETGLALGPHGVAHDSSSSLVLSDGPAVALVGVEDLVVVVEDGAVLVARRDRAQDVKEIVEALKRQGRDDLL